MAATPLQEVWLLKHEVWGLLDDGLNRDEVTDRLEEDGIGAPIAAVLIEKTRIARKKSVHNSARRERIIEGVRDAVKLEDPDEIVEAMDPACDDERTIFEMFAALSHLLFGPPPGCKWAAFGLSKMVGYGDYALVKALEEGNDANRYFGAFALGTMEAEAENAIDALKVALKDPDARVRKACQKALKRIRNATRS